MLISFSKESKRSRWMDLSMKVAKVIIKVLHEIPHVLSGDLSDTEQYYK